MQLSRKIVQFLVASCLVQQIVLQCQAFEVVTASLMAFGAAVAWKVFPTNKCYYQVSLSPIIMSSSII